MRSLKTFESVRLPTLNITSNRFEFIITRLTTRWAKNKRSYDKIVFRNFSVPIESHLYSAVVVRGWWRRRRRRRPAVVVEKFKVNCVQAAPITTRNQFVSNPTVSANPVKLMVGSRRPEVYLKFFVINPLLSRPTPLNRTTHRSRRTVLSDNKNSDENIRPADTRKHSKRDSAV